MQIGGLTGTAGESPRLAAGQAADHDITGVNPGDRVALDIVDTGVIGAAGGPRCANRHRLATFGIDLELLKAGTIVGTITEEGGGVPLEGARVAVFDTDAVRTVGDHIRKRRMDRGLLQREVATEIGVHHKTLALWERARTSPAVRHWPEILRFLGYDPTPEPQSIAELLIAVRRKRGVEPEAAGSTP